MNKFVFNDHAKVMEISCVVFFLSLKQPKTVVYLKVYFILQTDSYNEEIML